jgi:hypothetical protein
MRPQVLFPKDIGTMYEHTLEKNWHTFELVRPPHENKLPVVLSVNPK